ncbi:MAG: antiviral reverse transcriptase Drt3a [Bacteroidota bacterium]
MLDQSFSTDNFKKILDFENRKGKNLEKMFFTDVFKITKDISEINIKINYQLTKRIKDDPKLVELIEKKNNTKKSKEDLLINKLEECSSKLSEKKFKFTIKKIDTGDKPIYTIENLPENYFAMKQLQYNLKKSFKVKQANRFAIVDQLNGILTDDFPKIILRTDIKSFYESIPHEKLLAKINENNLLSFLSKKLIWKLLKDYKELSGSQDEIGIPRGIGISAYLAELFMRNIDNEIKSLSNVTYYSRYVDDIIIIFTPKSKYAITHYKEQIKHIIENSSGLKINEGAEKTKEIELLICGKTQELNFLGYKFIFSALKFQQIKLTDKKIERYKERIRTSLEVFNKEALLMPKLARRSLIHRINFLTSNTRLANNKDNVLVGIYYSNSLLTDKLEDLIELDNYFHTQIDALIANPKLINRLKMFGFKKGFEKRTYSNFNSKIKKTSLKEILEIW